MKQIRRANVFTYARVKTEKKPPKPKLMPFFLVLSVAKVDL